MRADEAQHAASIAKVGVANGAALVTAYFELLNAGLTFISLVLAITYTGMKLYELVTGKEVAELWRRKE